MDNILYQGWYPEVTNEQRAEQEFRACIDMLKIGYNNCYWQTRLLSAYQEMVNLGLVDMGDVYDQLFTEYVEDSRERADLWNMGHGR